MDILIDSDCPEAPLGAKVIESQSNVLLNLLVCLGYDPQNLPLASLYQKLNNYSKKCLIVSPIHWVATHNDARLVLQGPELNLSVQHAYHAYELYARYLATEDILLHFIDSYTWLMEVKDKPQIVSKSVHYMLNKPLIHELQEIDPSLFWQKFITESQMFFSANLKDSNINGVWVWSDVELEEKRNIRLLVDESFEEVAHLCSLQVERFTPEVHLRDIDIILIKSVQNIHESQYKAIAKRKVDWYWNNLAYSTPKSTWFKKLSRLWS